MKPNRQSKELQISNDELDKELERYWKKRGSLYTPARYAETRRPIRRWNQYPHRGEVLLSKSFFRCGKPIPVEKFLPLFRTERRRLAIRGLIQCLNRFFCAKCSYDFRVLKAREVAKTLHYLTEEEGLYAGFIVMTISHRQGEPLKEVNKTLFNIWRRMLRHSRVFRTRLTHYIRFLDLTVGGPNGPHPHFNLIAASREPWLSDFPQFLHGTHFKATEKRRRHYEAIRMADWTREIAAAWWEASRFYQREPNQAKAFVARPIITEAARPEWNTDLGQISAYAAKASLKKSSLEALDQTYKAGGPGGMNLSELQYLHAIAHESSPHKPNLPPNPICATWFDTAEGLFKRRSYQASKAWNQATPGPIITEDTETELFSIDDKPLCWIDARMFREYRAEIEDILTVAERDLPEGISYQEAQAWLLDFLNLFEISAWPYNPEPE